MLRTQYYYSSLVTSWDYVPMWSGTTTGAVSVRLDHAGGAIQKTRTTLEPPAPKTPPHAFGRVVQCTTVVILPCSNIIFRTRYGVNTSLKQPFLRRDRSIVLPSSFSLSFLCAFFFLAWPTCPICMLPNDILFVHAGLRMLYFLVQGTVYCSQDITPARMYYEVSFVDNGEDRCKRWDIRLSWKDIFDIFPNPSFRCMCPPGFGETPLETWRQGASYQIILITVYMRYIAWSNSITAFAMYILGFFVWTTVLSTVVRDHKAWNNQQ